MLRVRSLQPQEPQVHILGYPQRIPPVCGNATSSLWVLISSSRGRYLFIQWKQHHAGCYAVEEKEFCQHWAYDSQRWNVIHQIIWQTNKVITMIRVKHKRRMIVAETMSCSIHSHREPLVMFLHTYLWGDFTPKASTCVSSAQVRLSLPAPTFPASTENKCLEIYSFTQPHANSELVCHSFTSDQPG